MRNWTPWQYLLLHYVCISGILFLIHNEPPFTMLVVALLLLIHGISNYVEGYQKAERRLTINAVIKSVEKYKRKDKS